MTICAKKSCWLDYFNTGCNDVSGVYLMRTTTCARQGSRYFEALFNSFKAAFYAKAGEVCD